MFLVHLILVEINVMWNLDMQQQQQQQILEFHYFQTDTEHRSSTIDLVSESNAPFVALIEVANVFSPSTGSNKIK